MSGIGLDEAERLYEQSFQAEHAPEPPPVLRFAATPWTWRDPRTFPRRQWLYGYHLIRKFLSCTVAPGGVGKTSLLLVEAVAMATGRSLLGVQNRRGPLKVWVINLEDPREEIERRILAILIHYEIDPAELDGQLFIDSGRDMKGLVVATATRDGVQVTVPVVDALTAELLAREADVLIVDPFVKAHRIPENDATGVDVVATAFAGIADAANCAIDLVHHVRKNTGGEITVEDARGSSALLSAVRSARVLNPMSRDEAERAGVKAAREHFRAENGKANLAPPPEKADWFKLVSVSLGNGGDDPFDLSTDSDRVAVVEQWTWPDPLADVTVEHLRRAQAKVREGRWRENHQAKDWVGKAVADVLGLDVSKKSDKTKVLGTLKTWMATGMFVVVEGEDEKRNKRSFVEVGEAAAD